MGGGARRGARAPRYARGNARGKRPRREPWRLRLRPGGFESGAGAVFVRGRAFPTRRALWAALETLVAERRGLTLLYPPSFERHVANLKGVTKVKVGSAEQRAGYGPTLAAVVDGELRHDGERRANPPNLDRDARHGSRRRDNAFRPPFARSDFPSAGGGLGYRRGAAPRRRPQAARR